MEWIPPASELARITHSSPRTAARWRSNPDLIPAGYRDLIRIRTGRSMLCDDFDGWLCHSGKLWTPTGDAWTPGQIYATGYRLQQLSALRAAQRATPARLSHLTAIG